MSKFIHDCLSGYAPLQFNSWFNLNSTIHNHHTRSNVQLLTNNVINTSNLFIPFARTTHMEKNQLKYWVLKSGMKYPIRLEQLN